MDPMSLVENIPVIGQMSSYNLENFQDSTGLGAEVYWGMLGSAAALFLAAIFV